MAHRRSRDLSVLSFGRGEGTCQPNNADAKKLEAHPVKKITEYDRRSLTVHVFSRLAA